VYDVQVMSAATPTRGQQARERAAISENTPHTTPRIANHVPTWRVGARWADIRVIEGRNHLSVPLLPMYENDAKENDSASFTNNDAEQDDLS
jgi:hypothetical protein